MVTKKSKEEEYLVPHKNYKKYPHNILNFAFWSAKPKIFPIWPLIEKRFFKPYIK